MTEEDRSAKVGGNVHSSAMQTGTGNTATITITYYYYRENIKVVPAESTDAADKSLPCPYRGLFHFGPNDAEVFFGREIFVKELYSATKTRNFIPVLGASGSGKSSVVLAGLVPKLQKEGHWKFTHFRPGVVRTKKRSSIVDPFYALATALVPLYTPELNATAQLLQASDLADGFRDGKIILSDVILKVQQNHPNHRVLLIADQFEELYTLCEEESRRRFLDILLDSIHSPISQIHPLVLVTTMRVDFLGNALSYPPFADLLRSVDIKIRSMNREELSSVIEKPADKLGVTFEAGLVERLLKDVEDQPGNLPLLEFALTELWNKRTGKQLTHEIYEEIGQVEGALARHADEKYGNLTDEEKEKVRRIFIQLVHPGEGAEDTRRIAMKAELGEQSWSLVKQLADARLVVTSRNATSQETVEVVHEAIIRNWGELGEWMNTDRVFRAWQERLRALKREWEDKNEDRDSLLRGAALAEAEEKLKERPEELIAEKAFIEQSIQERDRLLKQEQKRRKYQPIAVSMASAILAGFAIFASFQWRKSEIESIRVLNKSSEAFVLSNQRLDARIASLQAARKFKQLPLRSILPDADLEKQVTDALVQTAYGGEYVLRQYNRLISGNSVESSRDLLDWSPDGKILAFDPGNKTVKLWQPDGTRKTLEGHSHRIAGGSWNRDGILATIDTKGNIILWDRDGNQKNSFKPPLRQKDSVSGMSWSPDGQHLAVHLNVPSINNSNVYVWKQSDRQWKELKANSAVFAVSWSRDGTVATGTEDGNIKLFRLDSSEPPKILGEHGNWVTHLSWSPDGTILASVTRDVIVHDKTAHKSSKF